MPRNRSLVALLVAVRLHTSAPRKCKGTVSVPGSLTGSLEVIDAPSSSVHFDGSTISLPANARAYLGQACDPASGWTYRPVDYSKINLLGKYFRYEVDLSQTGCGCAATVYFVPMAQSTNPTAAGDYYCDASGVGGASPCTEFDVQEANGRAFHTVLHSKTDKDGVEGGYGGGEAFNEHGQDVSWIGPRDFTRAEYGPGASCIDTRLPFTVTAVFPRSRDTGNLAYAKSVLKQGACELHTKQLGASYFTAEMTAALSAGLTPVLSHWTPPAGSDMRWLSAKGSDGLGPCDSTLDSWSSADCGTVKLSAFEMGDTSTLTDLDDDDITHSQPPGICCFAPSAGFGGDWCGGCASWAADGSYCASSDACATGCSGTWCVGAATHAPTHAPTHDGAGDVTSRAPTHDPTDWPTPPPTHDPVARPTPVPPTLSPSAPTPFPTHAAGFGNGGGGGGGSGSASSASVGLYSVVLLLTVLGLAMHFNSFVWPRVRAKREALWRARFAAERKQQAYDVASPIHGEL